jgi:hypothetical protein
MAIYLTGLATILLLAIPFIPGLRDIPRWIPVHRLIWRNWEPATAGPPATPASPTTGTGTGPGGTAGPSHDGHPDGASGTDGPGKAGQPGKAGTGSAR